MMYPMKLGNMFFAFMFFVAIESVFGQQANLRSVVADSVRIRSAPSLSADVIGFYNRGDTVLEIDRTTRTETIGGKTGVWVKVERGCADRGWVFGAFLGSPEQGIDFAFSRAQALEYSDPAQAIVKYQDILRQFPLAKRAEGCHGLYEAKQEIPFRIDVVSCIRNDNRGSPKTAELVDIVKKAIQTNDPKMLQTIIGCDFSIFVGPIQLQYLPAQSAQETLKLFRQHPPALSNLTFSDNEIRIPFSDLPGQFHKLYFSQHGGKRLLSSYCSNC